MLIRLIKSNPRTTAIRAIAKANHLHLDIIYAEKDYTDAYEALLKVNPLGQVPTFVGADGYVLTECVAVALYSACERLKPKSSSLLH